MKTKNKGLLAEATLKHQPEETEDQDILVKVLYITTKTPSGSTMTYMYAGPEIPETHEIIRITVGPLSDAMAVAKAMAMIKEGHFQ